VVTINETVRCLARAFALAASLSVMAASILDGQRRPVSESDSIRAHATAVDALRQFQYQYTVLITDQIREMEMVAKVTASCERRIADFCYGPRNGQLKMGGIGTFRAYGALAAASESRKWRRVSDARLRMYINVLRAQLARIPGDRWIIGELVRLHTDHGQLGRAEDELKVCRAEAWWCGALRAHVKHQMGEWVAADSIWSEVLSALPAEERCEWLNPASVIGDGETRDWIDSMSCAERERIAARIWWLSDPFHSRPGNERRSAHFSRIVTLAVDAATQLRVYATPAMMRDERIPPLEVPMLVGRNTPLMRSCASYGNGSYGFGGGSLLVQLMQGYPELVMRVGPPHYCAVATISAGEGAPTSMVAQYPAQRYSFVPAAGALQSHLNATASDWYLRDPAAHEFFTEWTRPITDLPYQAAWFRRGDSLHFVLASEAPPPAVPDPNPPPRPVPTKMLGYLWMQQDFDKPELMVRRESETPLIFGVRVPDRRELISLEVNLPRGEMGRIRFSGGPPPMPSQRVTLSDVLVVRGAELPPANLAEAEPLALGSLRLKEGSVVGLYWEVYGLRAGDTPRVSLLVVPQRGSQPLRLGREERRLSGQDVVVNEWVEPPAAGHTVEPRAINVSISTLRRGRYTVSVAVSLGGRDLVESVRTIEVVR
jgi:hypothetical protein